jgi:hypothetical protein
LLGAQRMDCFSVSFWYLGTALRAGTRPSSGPAALSGALPRNYLETSRRHEVSEFFSFTLRAYLDGQLDPAKHAATSAQGPPILMVFHPVLPFILKCSPSHR